MLWVASIPARYFYKKAGEPWKEFKEFPWIEPSMNIPKFSQWKPSNNVPKQLQAGIFRHELLSWIKEQPTCHGKPIILKKTFEGCKIVKLYDSNRELTISAGNTNAVIQSTTKNVDTY